MPSDGVAVMPYGLLGLQPDVGAVTANRNMLSQAERARQVNPRPMLEDYRGLQTAGMIPGLGLLGIAGDVQQYIQEPETRGPLAYGLTALGAIPFLGAMARMAGPMPRGLLRSQTGAVFNNGAPQNFERGPLSVPDSLADKFTTTPGGSAFYKDNLYLALRQTPDGKVVSHYSPPWGSTSKEFHGVGDTFDEVLSQSLDRIKRSDAAVEAAKKSKYEKSILGILSKDFGDDAFDFVRSQRSKSEYLIHKGTGTKIRISDHDLPLGYPPADLDLPLSMSAQEKANAIKEFLK